MNQTPFAALLMRSTNHAIQAEHVLRAAGLACKLIPVPRSISSECGVCARIAQADKERAIDALTAADMQIVGIHDL